jgi:hypothetical protein
MPDSSFLKTAKMMSSQMTNNKEQMKNIINWAVTADRETYVFDKQYVMIDQTERFYSKVNIFFLSN